MYSRYKFPVIYMIYTIFLLFGMLDYLFTFWVIFFEAQTFLIRMKPNLSNLLLLMTLVSYLRNHCLTQVTMVQNAVFSFKSFIVSTLTYLWFTLNSFCIGVQIHYFAYRYPIVSAPFVKKTTLCSLSKFNWPFVCFWTLNSVPLSYMFIFMLSLLFLQLPCESKWSEVTQSCPTLCNPMDCSLPGSSLHGILQARVLKWVASSFSRGSSQPRDQTPVSRIPGRYFNLWATREAQVSLKSISKQLIHQIT